MTAEFPEWQGPILNDLWRAVIAVLPDGWESAELELATTDRGFGRGLSHSIAGTPGSSGLAFPDDAVFETSRRLELEFVERGLEFRRALIGVVYNGKAWDCSVHYEY
jgi:hypothetical protein